MTSYKVPPNVINKVIEMYLDNPFTEFTIENLKPIRVQTALGYMDIKGIILNYIKTTNK